MKTNNVILTAMLLLVLIVFNGCKKDGDNDSDSLKGLVQVTDWGYSSNTLFFKLSIQYAAVGSPTDLEYAIYDGNTVIQKGSARTVNQDAGLNIFFETPEITISLLQSTYTGKTIVIWADPDNKKTLDTYTNETYVDLYKKQEVIIP
ncbi:MAG: hypothetical protein JNL22_05990 [Bacteroidales bacterium]|nr:hypothetical protein [Bacteroidales bacterium]